MTLGRTIDHPDFITVAPQILSHLLEARAIQEPGNCNEARDAISILFGLPRRIMPAGTEDLQRRPTPEIDVEVLKMVTMSACLPFWRCYPPVHRRHPPGTTVLNPASLPIGVILIRRIADDDGDRLRLLNC